MKFSDLRLNGAITVNHTRGCAAEKSELGSETVGGVGRLIQRMQCHHRPILCMIGAGRRAGGGHPGRSALPRLRQVEVLVGPDVGVRDLS